MAFQLMRRLKGNGSDFSQIFLTPYNFSVRTVRNQIIEKDVKFKLYEIEKLLSYLKTNKIKNSEIIFDVDSIKFNKIQAKSFSKSEIAKFIKNNFITKETQIVMYTNTSNTDGSIFTVTADVSDEIAECLEILNNSNITTEKLIPWPIWFTYNYFKCTPEEEENLRIFVKKTRFIYEIIATKNQAIVCQRSCRMDISFNEHTEIQNTLNYISTTKNVSVSDIEILEISNELTATLLDQTDLKFKYIPNYFHKQKISSNINKNLKYALSFVFVTAAFVIAYQSYVTYDINNEIQSLYKEFKLISNAQTKEDIENWKRLNKSLSIENIDYKKTANSIAKVLAIRNIQTISISNKDQLKIRFQIYENDEEGKAFKKNINVEGIDFIVERKGNEVRCKAIKHT